MTWKLSLLSVLLVLHNLNMISEFLLIIIIKIYIFKYWAALIKIIAIYYFIFLFSKIIQHPKLMCLSFEFRGLYLSQIKFKIYHMFIDLGNTA